MQADCCALNETAPAGGHRGGQATLILLYHSVTDDCLMVMARTVNAPSVTVVNNKMSVACPSLLPPAGAASFRAQQSAESGHNS